MRWLAAALLLLALRSSALGSEGGGAQGKDDKAAEALLKEARQKIEAAKSLRVEYTMEVVADGQDQGTAKGKILLKGRDRWRTELDFTAERQTEQLHLALVSDGRKVSSLIPSGKTLYHTMTPAETGDFLRQGVATNFLLMIMFAQPQMAEMPEEFKLKPGGSSIDQVRDGGKEKVGDRDARVVEYAFKMGTAIFGDQAIQVKALIDPATKSLLKRELNFMGAKITETLATVALDEDIPDSEFAFQSMKRVARARTEQAARSVELFARFTGRSPASFDELARRPAGLEADVFFPEGGFLGATPNDPWGRPFGLRQEGAKVFVTCLGADGKPGGKGDDEDAAVEVPGGNRLSVGAPTDRLKKQFAARVRLHLLAASVRAFQSAYGELPKKRADLWQKPEWVTVWPDGGWLAGGRLPDDPWGEPLRMISETESVRVQVQDPKARLLGVKQLTAEERKSLEETAKPRLSADERKEMARLIEDLGQDDLDAREKAESRLKAFGLAAVATLEERLKTEKDAETKGRLAGIRKSIRVPRAAWMEELATLQIPVSAAAPGPHTASQRHSSERNASASLKTIATAQADFRANDRDGNKIQDFWTGDIAGLYCIYTQGDANKQANKLIELSVAAADAAPLEAGSAGGLHLGIEAFIEKGPKAGYHFRSMTQDNSVTPPESYLQDSGGTGNMGKVHHFAKFGACAYPADYPASGTWTFIINEGNTIFKKDTGGEPVLEWPSDADLRNDWSKLD